MSSDFENVAKKLNSLTYILEKETHNIKKDISEKLLGFWQSKELPEIVKTKGASINSPFGIQKKADVSNWKKKRKYNVPFGWVAGVYSGETYWALWKGESVGNTKIEKNAGKEGMMYDFNNTKQINFNIGISKRFENEALIFAKESFEALIKKALK